MIKKIFEGDFLPKNPFRRKKVGLALGGGGAKGIAHIGVT